MSKLSVGLALTGSYCTYDRVLTALERLTETFDVTPIMSETACVTDSRFGSSADFVRHLEAATGKKLIRTIVDAEPVGPKNLFDVLVIAPCTGNTAAKLAAGITDSCVLMAAKSHLRGGKPVLIAFGSNDGLSASARNIGELLVRKNIYFLPFYQDDPVNKPNSLASDYSVLEEAILAATQGRQIQPLVREKPQIRVNDNL